MSAQAEAQDQSTPNKWPVKALAKETLREFKHDDVPDIAASVAYHAIFAIPPMIVFLISLAAIVNQFTDVPVAENLMSLIDRSAPGDTKELLRGLVESAVDRVGGGTAIFSIALAMLIALWSGSNGVTTFIKAFNRAYDVEENRSFIKQKLTSLGLTVLMSALVILAFALFVFGHLIGYWIADKLGMGSQFELVWFLLRWPAGLVFIMFLLAVLYYLGPNVEQSFRWISPGSIVATLLWIAIVFGFKLYLTISDPGSAYGTVGSVVVLLFFLYLTAIAFVIGAEINAVLGRRYDPETIEDLAENPQKIEGSDNRAKAQTRAENLDRREGTSVSDGATADAVARERDGAKAPRDSTRGRDGERRGGRGSRVLSGLGSLVLALLLSRFRRRSREAR